MADDFGLSLHNVRRYEIDDYSTPDHWRDLGFELQYNFSIFWDNLILKRECENFIRSIIDCFLYTFSLTQEHLHYMRYVDEAKIQLLYKTLGLSRDGQAHGQPFKFILLIFFDKGPLD